MLIVLAANTPPIDVASAIPLISRIAPFLLVFFFVVPDVFANAPDRGDLAIFVLLS
jgi:hypothetical protein